MYNLGWIDGIDGQTVEKLRELDINVTSDLARSLDDDLAVPKISMATGVDDAQVRNWISIADILRIKGVGKRFATLLWAAGARSVSWIAEQRADDLCAHMAKANRAHRRVRRPPTLRETDRWIQHAKLLSESDAERRLAGTVGGDGG